MNIAPLQYDIRNGKVNQSQHNGWPSTVLVKRAIHMPTTETLERFIARVEENAHVEACEEFYTAESSMQENQSTPRVGREAHVANERKIVARAKSIVSKCVRPVLVNGDHVVIRWTFHFEWRDGKATHMEELAYQRWEGERIAEETFFYDPAQRIPK
jgi:ketosteroid isomerase-like protein